jgi:EPS-associated MarR family transcriptional regulator
MVEREADVGRERAAAQQRDAILSDEMRLKLMRLFEANPHASQRDAARGLAISVGKVNYCLRALVHKGWIKANRFRNSRDKVAYRYLLTTRGFEAKAALTLRFLRIKMREYETLRGEIEQLRREAASRGEQGGRSQP